jgi:phosphoribosylformylglycinamidine synthase
MRSIAGVANERFNVFGLMPHPEHAVEKMLGGDDGLKIFQSIIESG